MKFTPRTKKLLALMAIVTIVVTATGCTAPKDANGHIILISESTTFGEIFQTENWFSALFVWPLSWVLNKLAPVITVGGAIAIVTVVVNGLLAVFTLKSQMGMQRMQMLQPELNKIQRKYEGRDDQASKMRMAQEQQQLMRKYNVNPGSMMLVQFVQLPIIMAMFMAIQRAEAVVNGGTQGSLSALDAVNQVRARVGMPVVASVDMNVIERERILELTQEGHRFFDLLRWGKVVQRFRELEANDPNFKQYNNSAYLGFQEHKNEWLPLPVDEVEGNPYIQRNNPGW